MLKLKLFSRVRMALFTRGEKMLCEKKSCVAIVPAAGSSSRMKDSGNKLFIEIAGVPVIVLTLLALQNSPFIDQIIIPTQKELIPDILNLCKVHSLNKVKSVVCGGKTRVESVFNGIKEAGERFELIAIHDAARPFVSQKIIEETILSAGKYDAAAPATPIKDTVKEAKDSFVTKTLVRSSLFAIQTPQVFESSLIEKALESALKNNLPITDDCSAVEEYGKKVFLTEGDFFNIKITTPEDIVFSEAILKKLNEVEKCE